MPKSTRREAAPFSVRLTFDERRRLEVLAAGMPLGAYIRARLLEGTARPRRTRGRFPVKDHAALARLLAGLGASRLASNLNQLARAAHAGALPVSPAVEAALRDACRDIAAMKALLIAALGLRQEG